MIIIRPLERSFSGLPSEITNLIEAEILPGLVDEVEDSDPDDESYLILIENMADFESPDHQLYYGNYPDDVYWEYVSYLDWGFFAEVGVNQIVGVLVPDASWLNGNIRRRLMDQAR